MKATIVVTAAALCLGGQALADGYVAAGKTVALQWCAGCHVVNGGKSGQDGPPPFRSIANRPNVTTSALRAFLFQPHGRMPDLQISRRDQEDVIAYILSLKGVK